jgi:anthranilate synthase component 1/salicylate synthetase
MNVRERGSVQHLASRISGRLATGRRAWDAFDAVFPGVTASGVPKEAALAHIREHEPQPRGLYGAAVITFDHEGTLDAALVLRAIYRQHGLTWLRAGGGIVAQSVPSRELEETTEKLGSVARFLVPSVIPAAPEVAEVAGAGSSD